ncbi:hypothetical protein KKB55_15535 [Myxococcota bacterium]|nr:hypothetical protein [Myxococcota bacterium]MBU1899151.1 hypothetical protein [Myxococcota bacterium]
MNITPRQARLALARRAARRSLAAFVKLMWPVLNPGVELVWSWHMTALCEALEKVTRGELRRVLINVPPGSSKSSIVTMMWPCWEWLEHPERRWICASYDLKLSTEFNLKRRALIQSNRYQFLRPDWRMVVGQREKRLFRNSAWGEMSAFSTTSGVTGKHGDRIVVDDPIHSEAIYGPELEQHVRWFDKTVSTRFRDLSEAAWVVVMQRLHAEDLAGHLEAQIKDDPEALHLLIQAEYDPEHAAPYDPRRVKGESFFPRRFPINVLQRQKKKLGSLSYAAQYQQQPTDSEGNMIKRDWWQRWRALPDLRGAVWIGAWDTAYESGDTHDPSVGQVWVLVGAHIYLVDQVRGRFDFVEMERRALQLARRWPQVPKWLVEQRALGEALISRLKLAGIHVEPFKSQSTKVQRVVAITPMIEHAQVWLPDAEAQRPEILAPVERWALPEQIEGFIEEAAQFPKGKNDDQIDTASMALGYLSPWVEGSGGEDEGEGAFFERRRFPGSAPRMSG